MGRRKISIQPITDERNRKVTFVKRKAGLFKKAHELAVLCQVDLAVVILGNSGSKFYEYSSVDIDELMELHKDSRIVHDTNTPSDYGDYLMKSRVIKAGLIKTHNRNASSVSLSIDENESDDDEGNKEEEDENEDNEEDDIVPPSKKRKITKKVVESKKKSTKASSKEQKEPQPQSQQLLPPPPPHLPNIQQHQFSHQPSHIPYGSVQTIPPQYQQLRSTLQQGRILHPQMPFDSNTVPPSSHLIGSFPNPLPGNVPQYQFPSFQFTPGTPVSTHSQDQQSVSTPVVTNSKGSNSPFTTSRARSLNNNISSRPVLSLKIPGDNLQTSKTGDSAMTITALDTSKNDIKSPAGDLTPSSAGREGTSADGNKTHGLGISSNKSTPISATLPSGLFSLPVSQPSHHSYSNQAAFKLMAGEQTPLTGGLPSKYVPDLFPSPSNFYSNDWNIPFGSGNTPYPNSAAGAAHQLPNISSMSNSGPGNGASGNGRLKKQYAYLNNDTQDSPLQNMSDMESRKGVGDLPSKKIKFEP